MSILEIKNLSVSFNKKQVLKDFSLSLDKSELCVLLGLNGSGKTTLLNSLCGFNRYSGEIIINNIDISSFNEKKRFKAISLISQPASLKDGFSALEVALMGYNPTLSLFLSPNKEQINNAQKVLCEMGLESLIERDFSTLSSGEKQLVILSRAIIQASPIMLFDEPDSALDFNNRHKILTKIKEIIKAKNYVGLITMHDPNFALRYADRLFILDNGRITYNIDMKNVSIEALQIALSSIYKDIVIQKYNGGYLVGKNE